MSERDAKPIARAVAEWKSNKEQNKEQETATEEDIYPEDPDDKRISDDEDEESSEKALITSHVSIPSQKEIEEALLRKKKQELLERYGCLDVKMES
ncbi:unnamed protein product [Plutella xylostella]|uniref:(diamondback moth) hypothetical protein n=1 Tax=Plutella xylostella TaxID=51655 RepID=A0A8S4EIX2_PLUXY|nr:unnamed protein product [Plutella xylostella]